MNLYNDRLPALIIFGSLFGIIVCVYSDFIHNDVYAMIYVSPIIISISFSMSLFRKYKKSIHYKRGFLFLALANISLLIAELFWILMPYYDLKQYGSYPDIFYMLYAIQMIIFPLFILKHYKVNHTIIHYTIILSSVLVSIIVYLILSDIHDYTFYIGFVFTVMSGVLVGISISVVISLHHTRVFKFWIIISCSFIINLIADITYYSSKNNNWDQGDMVNIIWFTSYLLLIFALYVQKSSYILKNN